MARTEILTVRLTPDEFKLVETARFITGESKSVFLRRSVMEAVEEALKQPEGKD